MQPLKPEYKSQIVHVELNENGRFTDHIIDVADKIIEEAEECNFDIINFATDADSKTNALHRSFYDFINGIEGGFDEKVDKMDEYEGDHMISDPLHLYKSMRRKYLTNIIQMSKNGHLINKENERKFLEMSNVYKKDVETNSQLATMRDDLSLILFNTQNLFILGQNERYSFFTFQFFIVLMITIHQSNNLSANARYQLCKLTYYSMTAFKKSIEKWQRTKILDQKVCNFIDNNNYMRFINNCFCFAYAFKHYGNSLDTVKLSSHPLELKFGDIRQTSRGKDTSDIAIHNVSKSLIREEILSNFGRKKKYKKKMQLSWKFQ